MITIQQLNYILTLSEEGSFSKASDRCFVTQPTLSMQIKKAEDTIGFELFDRSAQPITLTAFGTEFIQVATDILNEYGRIDHLIKTFQGSHREVIRMGIIPTVASYLIPDMYDAWKKHSGKIQLVVEEMKTDELLTALEGNKLDIGILSGPYSNSRFRSTHLFQEEILAYYPTFKAESIRTMDLSDAHPWLLTSGNCLRTQIIQFCNLKAGADIADWDYQGGNMDMLIDMVDKHGGYTLIPFFFGRTRSKKFKRIESETGEIPAREIIALTKNKTVKWDALETLIRETQHFYGQDNAKTANFKLLNWN
jgi:LysR family hydrogen peroxide-inducible transcriptional activator